MSQKVQMTRAQIDRVFGSNVRHGAVLESTLEGEEFSRDLATWDRDDLKRFYADVFERDAPPVEEVAGTVLAVLSTQTLDRHGSVFRVSGMDLKEFRKNPVVLWNHNSCTSHHLEKLPVGRCVGIRRKKGEKDGIMRLFGVTRFTPKEVYPSGHMVGELVRSGFVNMTSIGILPIEVEYEEDSKEAREERPAYLRWRPKYEVKKSELMEYSFTPIGSNRGAHVQRDASVPDDRAMIAFLRAKSAGIDLAPLVEGLERLLDGEGSEGDETLEERAVKQTALKRLVDQIKQQ